MNRPRTAACGVCGRRGQIVWQGRSYLFLTAHGYFVRAASGIWWAHVTPYDDDDHSFQPPRFPRTLSARGPAVRLVSVPTVRDGSDDDQREWRMSTWQARVAADQLKPWLGPLAPRQVSILTKIIWQRERAHAEQVAGLVRQFEGAWRQIFEAVEGEAGEKPHRDYGIKQEGIDGPDRRSE